VPVRRKSWLDCKSASRVSTDAQDLTAQREVLAGLGVDPARIYVDHGLTGTNRARPGLREALAACRAGDTLVVTKLDHLARSLPDAREILADLTTRQVRPSFAGTVHDPTDPVGRLLFNVLAMFAEFEADLIRLRTCEGMKIAKAKARLRGKRPKLTTRQEGPPRRPPPGRRAQHPRTRQPVRRDPIDRLAGDPTSRTTSSPWSVCWCPSRDQPIVDPSVGRPARSDTGQRRAIRAAGRRPGRR
jgi:DNA invertase Pin-like site-specific DNA recombinase